MTNSHLARLDRQLRLHGERVELRRLVGTGNVVVQCSLLAIINPLAVEQLIGGVAQQNFLVTISPSGIYKAGWPGGTPPAPFIGIIAPTDPRLPKKDDKLFVRGAIRNIDRVSPRFDGGACVRIELQVLG